MSESSAPDAEADFHPAEGAEIPSALFCVCGWEIEGSFWAHDYAILAGGGEIVTNHKEWMSWGDCCELDIADGQDEVPALRGAGAPWCRRSTAYWLPGVREPVPAQETGRE